MYVTVQAIPDQFKMAFLRLYVWMMGEAVNWVTRVKNRSRQEAKRVSQNQKPKIFHLILNEALNKLGYFLILHFFAILAHHWKLHHHFLPPAEAHWRDGQTDRGTLRRFFGPMHHCTPSLTCGLVTATHDIRIKRGFHWAHLDEVVFLE